MKRTLACAFLLTSCAAAAPAVTPAVTPEIAHLRAHTDFLADDKFQGRDTGSAGFDLAALYAATRFAEWGLEPGADGSYLQPVRFVESRVKSPSLVARRAGGRTELELGPDYVMLGGVSAGRIAVNAPVVFAGQGIVAPELGVDDYAKVDVKGKVVLTLSGAPASFPNDQRAHYSSRRLKAELAERAGAIGMLVLRDRSDEPRVPWERIAEHRDKPRTAFRHPDGAIADAFPGLSFAATLSRAGAAKLFEGTGLSYDSFQETVEKGSYESRSLPIRIQVGGQVDVREISSPNIAGILPGADAKLRGEYVVVTAHLDHVGVGPAVAGDTIYNGFYDNAIGSAILLETAKSLALAPERPRRSTLFLLVTGEERGLLGSDYFAHHPTVSKEAIVANVNVDMPLFFGPLETLVAFGGEHSTLGPLTSEVAASHGVALVPDPMPAEVIFVRSDQYSFVRQGVPSIYLNPGPLAGTGGEAAMAKVMEFIRQHYHQPSDETDLSIDWGAAAKFTAVQVDLVRRIGDAETRPVWNPGDFFGELFGK
jgi:Zn-dependent M28 family amino/carboxypeptidase